MPISFKPGLNLRDLSLPDRNLPNANLPAHNLSGDTQQPSPLSEWRNARGAAGFTLLELVVVIVIFGVTAVIVGVRSGNFAFWNEETAIRRLSETISFLHFQAQADQAFYQLELNLTKNNWRVGVLRPDEETAASLTSLAEGAGNLSLELAAALNPSAGDSQTFIPPPSYPSLAEPTLLPDGMQFADVVTMRGTIRPGDSTSAISGDDTRAMIRFTPRGFSEFAVIHLRRSNESEMTILVNPFTGITEIFPERREYAWTYGSKRNER